MVFATHHAPGDYALHNRAALRNDFDSLDVALHGDGADEAALAFGRLLFLKHIPFIYAFRPCAWAGPNSHQDGGYRHVFTFPNYRGGHLEALDVWLAGLGIREKLS